MKVRLGTDEEEDVRAITVTPESELDLGPGQLGRDPVDDASDRSPCPLVDEVLGVEGRQHLGVDRVEEGADGVTRTETGIDPSLEGDDEDGLTELGVREVDDVVVDLVVHHFLSKVIFALSASMAMNVGYSVTLPWSPPAAPAL